MLMTEGTGVTQIGQARLRLSTLQ